MRCSLLECDENRLSAQTGVKPIPKALEQECVGNATDEFGHELTENGWTSSLFNYD